jgi:hypothetical protein
MPSWRWPPQVGALALRRLLQEAMLSHKGISMLLCSGLATCCLYLVYFSCLVPFRTSMPADAIRHCCLPACPALSLPVEVPRGVAQGMGPTASYLLLAICIRWVGG